MILVLAVSVITITVLYFTSAGKYADIVSMLDKKEFPLKDIISPGLMILDIFKHNWNTAYDRKLLMATAELYGHGDALVMLRAHWGHKISLMLLVILFEAFVGVFAELDAGYAFFCISFLVSVFILSDRSLHERVKKRRKAILLEFPDFINKLTLLVNAGMTVTNAWEKAASQTNRQTPLYKELRTAVQHIRSGVPEHKAYEEFAKRCHVSSVTRFVSVILQNIRKGNSELVPVLRLMSNECWELRKAAAKKYGEEASTKLLAPMMLMFIAILLIVGMPAVLSLRNI